MFCMSCGAKLPSSVMFCPVCGQKADKMVVWGIAY